MLKIQVLGRGMIPRGLGLAPRREFFKADLTLIHTILMTPGLKVNMLNPKDGKIIPITNSNLKRLWHQYRSDVYNVPVDNKEEDDKNVKEENVEVTKDFMNPPVEESKVEKEEVRVDEAKIETNDVVVKPVLDVKDDMKEIEKEEKQETPTIKPIMNDNKNNNHNSNHNKKK